MSPSSTGGAVEVLVEVEDGESGNLSSGSVHEIGHTRRTMMSPFSEETLYVGGALLHAGGHPISSKVIVVTRTRPRLMRSSHVS